MPGTHINTQSVSYTRPSSAFLLHWNILVCRWMLGNTLGCLFAKEVDEALLSRSSARAKLHSRALEQRALFDLFHCLTHAWGPKSCRASRLAAYVTSFGHNLHGFCLCAPAANFCLTTAKITTFVGLLPEGFQFRKTIPNSVDEVMLKSVVVVVVVI